MLIPIVQTRLQCVRLTTMQYYIVKIHPVATCFTRIMLEITTSALGMQLLIKRLDLRYLSRVVLLIINIHNLQLKCQGLALLMHFKITSL